ncbi:MAG: hypothetical protein HOM51_11140 [Rhodospirillaceae bacterium]|nr:hypothetical protein [Rhodospirillaceae bacterium]
MKSYKGLLLGAVAASVFAAGALVTPAQADGSAVLGHKKGNFYLKSKDGNYSVLPGMKFQFDSTNALTDDSFTANVDTRQLDIPRIHFGFKGRAGSPNLTYSMLFNVEGGAFIDAQVNYKFIPEVQVKVGNYKSLGVSAGNRYSSSSGWLVDDPNGAGDVASGRNIGISLRGTVAKVLSYEAKLSNGAGNGVETASQAVMYDFGLSYQPFGRYGALNQPDYSAKNKLRAVVQVGYQGAQGAVGSGDYAAYAAAATSGTADLKYWHALVGVKYAGLHLTGTYEHGNFQTDSVGFDSASQNGRRQYVWMAAASYMVVPKKVPFAITYTVHNRDTQQNTSGDSNGGAVNVAGGIERQWGFGAAYLINGHKNKLHFSYDRISTHTNAAAIDGSDNNTIENDTFKLRWQVLF